MKLLKCLGIFSVILVVFVFILSLEPELSRVTTGDNRMLEVYSIAEKMCNESNLDYQLQIIFSQLRADVENDPDHYFTTDSLPPNFARYLCDANLAVALGTDDGQINRFNAFSGSFTFDMAREFILIDRFFRRRHRHKKNFAKLGSMIGMPECASEEELKSFLNAKMTNLEHMLNTATGLSTLQVDVLRIKSGSPEVFNSVEDTTFFFWDSIELKKGVYLYVFSSFEASSIDDKLPLISFLDANKALEDRIAYFDTVGQKFIGNRGFKAIIGDEILNRLNKMARQSSQETSLLTTENGDLLMGRAISGTSFRPLVYLQDTHESDGAMRSEHGLIFFVIACCILALVVETLVFSRGINLTVSRALIISMLVAILMPFIMGRSVFSMILREASDSERLRLERQLQNTLGAMDSGVRLMHANLFRLINNYTNRPEYIETLLEQVELGPDKPKSDVLVEVLQLCNRVFVDDYADRAFRAETINFLTVFGPQGFLRMYDRFKAKELDKDSILPSHPTLLFLTYIKSIFEKFYPAAMFADGLHSEGSDQPKAMAFVLDEIGDSLQGIVGDVTFHEILSNHGRMNQIRTAMGYVMFSLFSIVHQDTIAFLFGIGWDEHGVGPIYFTRALELLGDREAERQLGWGNSWYDFLDPEQIFLRPATQFKAIGGMNRQEAKWPESFDDKLMDSLIKQSFRGRTAYQKQVSGDQPALYQVLPGRYNDMYAMGAKQATGYLEKIENLRSWLFNLGMVLFLVFAVFAAANLTASFTSPLEHLLWGLRRVEKQDYDLKLKDSREDELGSISRSFNNMVRRLKERVTLEKFVAPSVKRLAENPELFDKAQQGLEEKVTIVFADLEGFDQLLSEGDEKQIHHKLARSLALFYEVAEKFNAEIDKVIGEKILLVFRHSRHNGKKNAVLSAVNLCATILSKSRQHRLKPVFGINSGTVISGIIGARTVRMDYTIIGDPVNVAARLCALAKAKSEPVLVSGSIKKALPRRFKTTQADIGTVRGKKQEVEVFSLKVKRIKHT